jgi:hypothetical protein
MKKNEILKRLSIEKLDDITVFIQNRYFNFAYTKSLIPNEWYGGLQCDFLDGTAEYKVLEKWLIEIAETTLKTVKSL